MGRWRDRVGRAGLMDIELAEEFAVELRADARVNDWIEALA
jgi:hypothetical protein